MQGTCAIVTLPIITVETIPSLNIDLLLEVKVVLQPLVLELLVEILELTSTKVIHDLLFKVSLIFNGHSLSADRPCNSLFQLTCSSAVILSSLARAPTASGKGICCIVSCLVLDVIAQVIGWHLAHFLCGELPFLVLALTITLLLASCNQVLVLGI